MEALLAAVKQVKVGDGLNSDSVIGPVQNEMQYKKLASMLESIKTEGLQVSSMNPENTFSDKSGFFINPVVVSNPPDTSKIVEEEPFGMFNTTISELDHELTQE